jgi:glyoxylase-like metal-dependent hydrolase (beta-lactamase superfamily II)
MINYTINRISRTACVAFALVIACFCSCTSNKKPVEISADWCAKSLRPELKSLKEIITKRKWFKVYGVGDSVYAIMEPYNYQEVISYLIIGRQRALLFDTGIGLDSISALVKELTPLPITVLNSHTHYDHIGGNHEFTDILAMNTAFTVKNAVGGYAHALVKEEVSPKAFCLQRLPQTDTANYHIKPFKIAKLISDGYVIDLGGRKLQVMAVPGHAPDAIALLDHHHGYLWTGDTFYQGPIWLFSQGTDLAAYQKSIARLAALAPKLKSIFPAHNVPLVAPGELMDANKAFTRIINGIKKGKPVGDKSLLFDFGEFSFLIQRDLLPVSHSGVTP